MDGAPRDKWRTRSFCQRTIALTNNTQQQIQYGLMCHFLFLIRRWNYRKIVLQNVISMTVETAIHNRELFGGKLSSLTARGNRILNESSFHSWATGTLRFSMIMEWILTPFTGPHDQAELIKLQACLFRLKRRTKSIEYISFQTLSIIPGSLTFRHYQSSEISWILQTNDSLRVFYPNTQLWEVEHDTYAFSLIISRVKENLSAGPTEGSMTVDFQGERFSMHKRSFFLINEVQSHSRSELKENYVSVIILLGLGRHNHSWRYPELS